MRVVTLEYHWPALATVGPLVAAGVAYAVAHREQLAQDGGWLPFAVGLVGAVVLAAQKPALRKADAPAADASPAATPPAALAHLDPQLLGQLVAAVLAVLAKPAVPPIAASDAGPEVPAFDPARAADARVGAPPNTTAADAAAATAALVAAQGAAAGGL
ncbi:hypothetical protein tb265_39150 [Gemmatimonadetes bacterium T265]|nr:hypothetical protein tb265_39150 [Gemmatimonadetes bacterium T265]